MADTSHASSGEHGGDEEDTIRPLASSDQRPQRTERNKSTGSSMPVTSNSSHSSGAAEQHRTRPLASSMVDKSNSSRNSAAGEEKITTVEKGDKFYSLGNIEAEGENRTTMENEGSSKAGQSNSSGNNAAGEESRTTVEKDGSSMVIQPNSPGNNAAREENRRDQATQIPSPPSSSCSSNSFHPPSLLSTNQEVAATAAANAATAIASPSYFYHDHHHHHPPLYPSFLIPVLLPPLPAAHPPRFPAAHPPPFPAAHPPPFPAAHPPPFQAAHPPPFQAAHPPPFQAAHPPPAPFDLLAAQGYSMLVCNKHQQYLQTMWQQSEERLLQMISRIVANSIIFFHIAQHQRGSNHLVILIERFPNVAGIIFPSVSNPNLFLYLMNNKYGRRVVIKTLTTIEPIHKEELYRLTEQYAFHLACNSIGYTSLDEIIRIVTGPYRIGILNVIVANVRDLSLDAFGAVVIRHVLDLNDPALAEVIGLQLYGYYTRLSSLKLGSYIVHRILRSHWRLVADDLLENGFRELPFLANDRFGYSIVKRILKIAYRSDRGRHGRIVSVLRPWIKVLRHGQHSHLVLRCIP